MPPLEMAKQSYRDDLLQASEAEIAGEAYFKALARGFSEPDHQEKLMLLAAVEQRTWKSLRRLISRHGLKPRDDTALAIRGVNWAEERAFQRWNDLMENMTTCYPGFIEKFKALHATGPDEDKDALQALVDHEVALLSFAEREVTGDTDSLSMVREYLAVAGA